MYNINACSIADIFIKTAGNAMEMIVAISSISVK